AVRLAVHRRPPGRPVPGGMRPSTGGVCRIGGAIMIGALPAAALAPLDYRYALDAAMTVLAGQPESIVRCNAPGLLAEIRQRIPESREPQATRAALWIEPLADTWRAELAALADALPPGARLVIVASRPLARLIPERRGWSGRPLGLTPSGLLRLGRALAGRGF